MLADAGGFANSYRVLPAGALSLTATVHGLPAYHRSNRMEGIVAT